MQFEEKSLLITLKQLESINTYILLFPDALEVLQRLDERPTPSGSNALLLSKKRS
jgi:hypothetical protein